MEESTRDDVRIRIYRATFGTTPLRVQFTLSADGKIAGLGSRRATDGRDTMSHG